MTASPVFTITDVTVPAVSVSTLFCIFMASSTTTVSPAATASPTYTDTEVIVPGSGEQTFVPSPTLTGAGVVFF